MSKHLLHIIGVVLSLCLGGTMVSMPAMKAHAAKVTIKKPSEEQPTKSSASAPSSPKQFYFEKGTWDLGSPLPVLLLHPACYAILFRIELLETKKFYPTQVLAYCLPFFEKIFEHLIAPKAP